MTPLLHCITIKPIKLAQRILGVVGGWCGRKEFVEKRKSIKKRRNTGGNYCSVS
jgi:hypothetical protein